MLLRLNTKPSSVVIQPKLLRVTFPSRYFKKEKSHPYYKYDTFHESLNIDLSALFLIKANCILGVITNNYVLERFSIESRK